MHEEVQIKKAKQPQSRIRVTYPNGESICYRNAKDTVVEVLKRIDPARYEEIKLNCNGRRLVTKEVHKKDEKYKEPLYDGWWYLNKLGNTDNKIFQLIEINRVLDLNIKIEHGPDLTVTNTNPDRSSSVRQKKKIKIVFEDGTVYEDDKYIDMFRDFVGKLGADNIARKNIIWKDEPLVTTSNINGKRSKLGEYKWFIEPGNTKEAAKMMNIIAIQLGVKCNIEVY